jgi:hypothetical protein
MMIIERRDFIPFVHEHPEVGLKLIEVLCERLRRTTQQVEDLLFLNLPARLAKALLRLADEAEGALPYKISITQREISQMIGVSRESINKHLRSWAQANWVVLKRGTIVVIQPEALADVAQEGLESQFARKRRHHNVAYGSNPEPLRGSSACLLAADFVAEVGCREPRTVIHRARCDAAAGAGDDGAAQTRPGAAVLFVLP